MRVHASRLNRGNPKEPPVELINPFHKPAPAVRGVLAGKFCGTPRTRIPTSVGHRFRTSFELVPERREIRRAGEAARHADDGDTVVLALHRRRLLRLHLDGRRTADVTELIGQVTGECGDVRVVEHHGIRGRVLPGERPIQPIPQFHRHQRVNPQLEEAHRGRGCRRQPQHRLHFLLQEGNEQIFARLRRCGPQLGKQIFRCA